MKRRDLARAMRKAGFRLLRDQGDHAVYQCPCGKHRAAVPRHATVSAGVVGQISKTACMTKGWL
ncbi:MAG TPA: type II toxin-antitoxin system HicA family toxin [Actinomycetes bacterium]|nr:type II toxin-antitoxin system HicA family toxin [Actinomycetes bacterium]